MKLLTSLMVGAFFMFGAVSAQAQDFDKGLADVGKADVEKIPDFTSMGGVAYTSVCDERGLFLKSLNETYRLRGYRASTKLNYFSSETLFLMPNCSVESPDLGHGAWCQSGGSNAGFEIDFLSSNLNEELSPNRMSFYGQEPFCESLVKSCICDGDE
ncbi:hypothetical protein N9B69_00195 [Amylibacter sp.]|nr:hypothetical protein [Amylibacter sp.]